MFVNNYYQTQKDHETCASLVRDQMRNWSSRAMGVKASSVSYAVGVRVLSATYFGKWIAIETVTFIPKMVSLGVRLLSSKEADFSEAFYHKVADVYWKVIRALLAEASVFISTCIAPEVTYHTLQMHKALFQVEFDAMVATIPDFPDVDRFISEEFPEFSDFAHLWNDWELDNSLWRNALTEACKIFPKEESILGSTLLNRDSFLFKKEFVAQVVSELTHALDRFQKEGTLTIKKLENMTPFVCTVLFNRLKKETQKQILSLSPALEQAFESSTDAQIALFEVYIGRKFRSPHTTQLCHILLEETKKARDTLLEQKVYTAADIEDCIGSSYAAIVSLGIYRFIENAELVKPDVLKMRTAQGLEVHLRNEQQFFGAKECFLDLKNTLLKLTGQQKENLFQRLCMKDDCGESDAEVTRCFHLIGRCKSDIIETKAMKMDGLQKQDATPWMEAFVVET